MASFRKRDSGQWQAQVRKKGYPTQTKSFTTRAAAAQWVRSIEYEMDQGVFVSRNEAETTTLGELLDRYLIEDTADKKGSVSEACRIRKLLRHPLAKRFVASIRGVDMARYRDERLKEVSGPSVRRELTILSQLFEVSRKEWGIFVHNPVREIKLPRKGKARDRRLQDAENGSRSEESRMFAACQHPNIWRAAFSVSSHSEFARPDDGVRPKADLLSSPENRQRSRLSYSSSYGTRLFKRGPIKPTVRAAPLAYLRVQL